MSESRLKELQTEIARLEELDNNITERVNEEFEAQIAKLREDARDYQSSRVKLTNELTQKRTEVTKKILDELKPILAKYIEKETISVILDKKNVIVGKTNLDITEIIIKKLDNQHPKIEIN